MKKVLSTVFGLALVLSLMTACSDTTKTSGEKSTSDAKKTKTEQKTKGTLKPEDYAKLFTDPAKYKNYEVEMTGKVFTDPEKDKDGTYLQIFADPEKSEKNVIVGVNDPNLKVKTDDYVKFKGIVKGKFEGENAFGGDIAAPTILADSVEVVDYVTAVAPTIKEITVGKEINQHNLSITLEKIQIAQNQTRVFLKVSNKTGNNASFYTGDAKLVVGNKQLEEEMLMDETGLPEVQSDILPGVETEGVIVYPAIDQNTASLKLVAEGSTDNYDIEFTPYTFDVNLTK